MLDEPLDPRPFLERPAHWRYGKCQWQSRYVWEERVAMSELGIGPDEAPLNEEGRVGSVSLRGRRISDARLLHLCAFVDLTAVDLVESSVTDGCIPHLQRIPKLQWLWVAGTAITDSGIRVLEGGNPALFVMKKGEGATRNPDGRWIKITRQWWPGGR